MLSYPKVTFSTNSLVNIAGGLGVSRVLKYAFDGSLPSSRFKLMELDNEVSQMKITGGNYRSSSALTKGRKRVKIQRQLATVESVKRMINGTLEKKQKGLAPVITAMVKNSTYSYNLTAQIVQGTTDGSRIGDSINLTNYSVNLRFATNPAAAFYQLRVIVLFSGEETNPSGTNFSTAGLFGNDIFVAGSAGFSTAIVNRKACTVLYDNLIEINSALDTFEDGHTLRFNVPLNQKFNYQSPGSVYGKTRNLYLVLVPDYIRTVATLPANNGSVEANGLLSYTDS